MRSFQPNKMKNKKFKKSTKYQKNQKKIQNKITPTKYQNILLNVTNIKKIKKSKNKQKNRNKILSNL